MELQLRPTDPPKITDSFSVRIIHFPFSRDPGLNTVAYLEAEEIVRSAIRGTIPPIAAYMSLPCNVCV